MIEPRKGLPETVLVVDDEPNIRALMETCLRIAGVGVWTAEDGVAALEVARSLRPDAVLLDVMMPRMDGLETCRRLRASPETSEATVVLCSAKDENTVDWRSVGADAFLPKPFDLRDVPRTLSAARRPPRMEA